MNNPFHILDSPEFSSNECDLPALRSLGLRGLPSTPTVAASTSELVDSLDTLHLERSQELGPDTLTRFPLTQPLLRPFELPPTPISPSPLAESSSSFTEIPEVFASQDYDITSYDGLWSPSHLQRGSRECSPSWTSLLPTSASPSHPRTSVALRCSFCRARIQQESSIETRLACELNDRARRRPDGRVSGWGLLTL
ncbi:hypothetical protein PLICRDRAFT_42004, partial [Plicaturopsis crispa FD-325 SS-3]